MSEEKVVKATETVAVKPAEAQKAVVEKKAVAVVNAEVKPAAIVTAVPAAATVTTPAVTPEVDAMAAIIHDPNAPVVSVKSLLAVGAHFGHMTRRWNPNFRPYIYTIRSGIHIVNLDKTAACISVAYKALKDIVAKGGKVLFVGTKKAAADPVEAEAVRSGSFYVNTRWLGGALTNFKTISLRSKLLKSLEQLEIDGVYDTMPKKIAIEKKKTQAKLAHNLEGIKEMRKTPDAMIVVDPIVEHNAVAEAKILHIPVFAILGTNCDPSVATYPIPCNDDSARTDKLILGILSDAIVEGKGGDVAYAYKKEDGENDAFNDLLKGIDRTEEFRIIKLRVREDQYAIRAAKKKARGLRAVRKDDLKKFARKPMNGMGGGMNGSPITHSGSPISASPVAEGMENSKLEDGGEDK